MKAHIFQHVHFEGPGVIQTWLEERGAKVHTTRFDIAHMLPDLTDVDLLVIMGGPMSVNDETALPWLRDEKRFIAECIAAGKAIIGICLGAQLIANALGARVYPGLQKEIGWFEIMARPLLGHETNLFRVPESTRVLHWHGETFSLPAGATRLAGSRACANQIFQFGARIIGLQCHLETTPVSAAALVTHCMDELQAAQGGAWVQTQDSILTEPLESFSRMNSVLVEILDFVTKDMN